MKAATPETSTLTYVIGCLYFCSETLSALGRKDCADELRKTCDQLAGSLERQQGCKLKVVASNG
ncbi:hypothetical protein [Alsobacter sp. SYSU BS001988]